MIDSRRAVAVAVLLGSCACKSAPSAGGGIDAASGVAAIDAALASRCTLGAAGATLDDLGDRRALLLGEVVPTNDGFAVGLVRAPKSGAEAIVARVSGHRVAEEWIIAKRGELLPDAPPPKPLLGPGVLYAAYLASGAVDGGARSRRILLAKSGTAAPVASFPVVASEALGFDAAIAEDVSHVGLVWDDDSARGGIELAIVPIVPMVASAPIGPRVVSDGVSDVDSPRIAPRAAGGWWVAWSVRREEPIEAGVRSEVTSEARSFSWVELVAVDAQGASVGPIHKVTSPTGHVGSFDMAPRSHGELDVFVRDETQSHEGEGGRILHVVVHEASIDDAVVVVPDGVGRGALDMLTGIGGEAWLTYADGADRSHLLPLGESRVPLGPATVEDALDGARLLALTSPGQGRFVAWLPQGDAGADSALFRDVTCAR